MKPSSAALVLVLLFVTGPAVAQQREERCGPWTDWSMPPTQGVSFSFRRCETPAGRFRIEWRWANMSDLDLAFAFWLYTKDPVNCEHRDIKSWASGKRRLRAGQQEDFASGRKNVAAMAYDFWLYWCIVPEG